MSYASTHMMKLQLAAQALLIAAYALMSWSPTVEALLAGVLLCTVGIPHGANDYLYRRSVGGLGLLSFTLRYLGIMALYALLWWWLPLAALILFFAISFHHFGQSNFENTAWSYPPSLLWGVYVLLVPVLLHWDEALGIFMQMTQPLSTVEAQSLVSAAAVQPTVWKYVAVFMGGGLYLGLIRRYEPGHFWVYALQWLLLTAWYLITPLLFGFVVVFCLWHSMQSLRHQVQHQQLRQGWSTRRFVLAMLPFGTAALAAFAAFVWWRGFVIGEAFILLSLITLPHVLVMHKLYDAEAGHTVQSAANS